MVIFPPPTYVHTYIHTYIHTYVHTYIHIYIRTYIHTYILHARTHAYTHTHTLQPSFPTVGSIHGVQIFASKMEATLLSCYTSGAKVVWKQYCDRYEVYTLSLQICTLPSFPSPFLPPSLPSLPLPPPPPASASS